MASGYGTCAEATPDLTGAVSVNGDGVCGGGGMGVYVLLGSCEADAPLLLLLCKNALELQHLLHHRSSSDGSPSLQNSVKRPPLSVLRDTKCFFLIYFYFF